MFCVDVIVTITEEAIGLTGVVKSSVTDDVTTVETEGNGWTIGVLVDCDMIFKDGVACVVTVTETADCVVTDVGEVTNDCDVMLNGRAT